MSVGLTELYHMDLVSPVLTSVSYKTVLLRCYSQICAGDVTGYDYYLLCGRLDESLLN